MEKPMIYILSGIAKSGKSLIADDIIKTHHMRVISTDLIMMMLHYGNDQLSIDIHKSDITVSHALKPYLFGMIKSLSGLKRDYLIEGVHIQPDFAYELSLAFPDKIRCLFLGYKDANPIIKAKELRRDIKGIDNPWYESMSDTELIELTTYMIRESEKCYHECLKYQCRYIEVTDIMKDKVDIIKELLSNEIS
jgi:hypothetical protein